MSPHETENRARRSAHGDPSDRFLTAAYYEAANRLSADVLADRDARTATGDLKAADVLLGLSRKAFQAHRYRAAYALAEQAYNWVVRAAVGVGVDPRSAAGAMKAEAARARSLGHDEHPTEFIDTLDPDGPRAQP